MPNVFDKQGKPISLGTELGRGGEGAVYEVTGRPETVAKLYHKSLPPEKAQKITFMASLQSERLLNIAAWPMSTIHNKPGEPVCGLLMPKANGFKEVHTLYGPKSRLTHFPNATWPFLIHAAMNVARAFTVMHEQGYVIGDVNQSSIYVSEKAVVKLIDCDSFQIVQNGRSYLCEVGVPTHTPPELQNKPFHGVTRTPNHDNFGLAIVIFQLLFMGRHPFSGQYLGPGEMSIEKAISEARFAYGPGAAARQMKQPPATLSLASVSSQISSYFEQAFTSNGMMPGGRPPAQDWVGALASLKKTVKPCGHNSGHQFLAELSFCPWCEIEKKSGILLFNTIIIGATKSGITFDVTLIWAQIQAVPHPGPLPIVAAAHSRPAPSLRVQAAKRKKISLQWICYSLSFVFGAIGGAAAGSFAAVIIFVICLVVAIAISNSPTSQLKQQAERNLKMVEAQSRSADERWQEAGPQTFDQRLKELEAAKAQLLNLPSLRQGRLNQLDQDRAKKQLEKYLDSFKIQNASIDGIKQGRVATLQSYGIETAGDVSESLILSIPGFGPSLTSKLTAWRRMIEQKFVFNPRAGSDPTDVATIEQDIKNTQVKLEQELLNGPVALQQISQQIRYKRETLKPSVDQAFRSLTTARADYEAIK